MAAAVEGNARRSMTDIARSKPKMSERESEPMKAFKDEAKRVRQFPLAAKRLAISQ